MRLDNAQMLLEQTGPLRMLWTFRERFRAAHRDGESCWSGRIVVQLRRFLHLGDLLFLDRLEWSWGGCGFGFFGGFHGALLLLATLFAFAFAHIDGLIVEATAVLCCFGRSWKVEDLEMLDWVCDSELGKLQENYFGGRF